MKLTNGRFTYGEWERFCRELDLRGLHSIPACEVLGSRPSSPFVVLKHDVETNTRRALDLAHIESRYSHRGSYYVQAYLLTRQRDVENLRQIQQLGHEVSYHYDVMDKNQGAIDEAIREFGSNLDLFERHGFVVRTVCQHGNPVIERMGYSSNRDFFRDSRVLELYGHITEMMVNFRSRSGSDYRYVSDAGYQWHLISDPENGGVADQDQDSRHPLTDTDEILLMLASGDPVIVSIHPHRWHRSYVTLLARGALFRAARAVVRRISSVRVIRRILGRFYYLAKHI